MKIWILTDYQHGHEDCLSIAKALGGEVRIIAEADLRGYMLRRFVQRERGNGDLPDIIISASPDAEHASVNIRHEIGGVFNVKLGAPRSKPHFRAFDLVVSYDPPIQHRLSPEEEARVLYCPQFDAAEIVGAIQALRTGNPIPVSHRPIGAVPGKPIPARGKLAGLSALFSSIGLF